MLDTNALTLLALGIGIIGTCLYRWGYAAGVAATLDRNRHAEQLAHRADQKADDALNQSAKTRLALEARVPPAELGDDPVAARSLTP